MDVEDKEVAVLKDELRQLHDLNDHLRDQLFAFHSRRVRMEGYLYLYKSYPAGLFSTSWELRYFSLVDARLKCFPNEQTLALIPLKEVTVRGLKLHWEGKKRRKFWTFGLRDASDCTVIRLSSDDRTTAVEWMTSLNSIGVSRSSSEITRVQSLPSPSELPIMDTPTMELPDVIDIPKEKAFRRSMVGSTPVHMETHSSVLSSERLFRHPHPGLLNLSAVILLAANFRLILENIVKYGFRVHPFAWFRQLLWGSSQPLMLCWPVLGFCCYSAYGIESMAVGFLQSRQYDHKKSDETHRQLQGASPESLLMGLHIVNLFVCACLPLWLVTISTGALLPSFVLTLVTMIIWMKLISYAHCNADLRRAYILHEARDALELEYPNNITLQHLGYFLLAPTLTYQLSYPRSERIRGKWLLRRCGEFILAMALQLAIIDQYIIPAAENSMIPLKKRDFVALVERVLKLSLPVLYAWFAMFYIFFHLWLNIVAEVLKFGDREFYMDWWNALNLGDYWKTWNMPVHKWMLRTIYYPALHRGLKRSTAMLLVFFVSALMHEVAVIVPLKFTSSFPWSFFGMLMQVPLIMFSQFLQKKFGDRSGNIIFWVSFCVVGQPIILLNYYYDWIQAELFK